MTLLTDRRRWCAFPLTGLLLLLASCGGSAADAAASTRTKTTKAKSAKPKPTKPTTPTSKKSAATTTVAAAPDGGAKVTVPADPNARFASPIGPLAGLPAPSVKLFDGSASFSEVAFRVKYRDASGLEKFFLGCALAALDAAQQNQGLMKRSDLAGYDAMIFAFDQPVSFSFYMKTVPMDLSIAWFDANGLEVGRADMKREEDCGATCPLYGPGGKTYRTAVEVPKGGLARIGMVQGAELRYGGPCR